MADTIITYKPAPTLKRFMLSNARGRWIKGPVGSGKSVCCGPMEIIRRAREQAPGPDGYRRTRFLVVRNTMPQLKDTTLKTWFQWLKPGEAGEWRETDKTFIIRIGDVISEVLFRPLDREEDVHRVLSLEITGVYFNEFREIPAEIIEAMDTRIGRYPAKKDGGPTWFGMWGDTNPPDEDTWWYDKMEVDTPSNWEIFNQPDGLSAEAENIDNLPPKYYENMCIGKSKQWIDVYVRNKYGRSRAGKVVWPQFNEDIHVSKFSLRAIDHVPLVLPFDFGLTPAALFMQQTPLGQVRVLREEYNFDSGLSRFCDLQVSPAIKNHFYQCTSSSGLVIPGDPAGNTRVQTDEVTCYDILAKKFPRAKLKPALTNTLVPRLGAVEGLLTRLIDGGQPALLIDPSCTWLIRALRSGYCYEVNKKGRTANTPDKNEYSHIADAFQYGAMYFEQAIEHRMRRIERSSRRVIEYTPATYIGY